MKKLFYLVLVIVCFTSFTFDDDSKFGYEPILMQHAELVKSIALLSPRAPKAMDKIYVKDNLLLITEKYKGVHVFDNSNPSNPINVGFLRIPGCVDVAMKGSVLYADNATDLVAVTLSNLKDIKVCSRVEDCLPELTPPGYNYLPSVFSKEKRPENTVIVEWKKL